MQTAVRPRETHPAVAGGVRPAICAAGEIWGGVERFVVTMAEGLRHAGVDPVIVVFHEGLLARALRNRGLDVDVLDRYGRYDPRVASSLRALLLDRGVTVLHVHGYRAAVVGGLAARGTGVRVVKTEHGALEPCPGYGYFWSHAKLAATMAAERAASRVLVDALVFVTRDMHRHRRLRGSRIPHRIIYNGIEPPARLAPTASAPRATFDLGIVGRIDRVKGHDVLLEALVRLSHLDGLRLHVFGAGPLEAECQRLSGRPALAGRVRFHGFDTDIHARIAALDLLVMPSRQEGLPYTLLEAMWLKVPVVASRVGGLREVLEPHRCGALVPPGDPAGLAEAIERLYRRPRLRAGLAARAHRLVRARFLATEMVRQYCDLYRAVGQG